MGGCIWCKTSALFPCHDDKQCNHNDLLAHHSTISEYLGAIYYQKTHGYTFDTFALDFGQVCAL